MAHNTKEDNLRFQIQFNLTNLRYLLGAPNTDEVKARIEEIKKNIVRLDTELESLTNKHCMKKYMIISYGHDGGPEFNDKKEAQDELKKMVAVSVKECRNRNGVGCVVKNGEYNYAVYVGKGKRLLSGQHSR